jgi:hypothetical protein
MTKLLPVMILSLILLQSLLLPANVQAQDPLPGIECPIIVTFTTLPATDVSITSAVFNGAISQSVRLKMFAAQQENENPFVFEYGTTPGVYAYRVNADMVSEIQHWSVDGEYAVLTWDITFKGTANNLSPCTTYYVRLRYLDTIPFPAECLSVIGPNEISFMTIGCPAYIGSGSHQSGGVTGISLMAPPTNLPNNVVQTAVIASNRVSPGEKVDVSATITNKGGSNGTSKVTLFINGQEVESKGITLSSGQSTTVNFTTSRNDPGAYTVHVNGVPAGSFTVDLFNNNDVLIYGIVALFTIGIIGVLYLVFRRRPA